MKLTRTKIYKILIIIPIILLITASLTITALYYFFPKEKILAFITAEAERVTLKTVVIDDLSYGLNRISLEGVTITDPEKNEETILDIDEMSLKFSLMSLFEQQPQITEITAGSLRMKLSFDSNGRSNIENLLSSLTEASEKPSRRTAAISKVILKDAQISLTSPPPYVGLKTGVYKISAEIIFDDTDKITVKNCVLDGPATVGKFYAELTVFTAERITIKGKARLENAGLMWVYKWKGATSIPFEIINGTVEDLVITSSSVSGNVKASSTLKNSPYPVTAVGEFKVDIDKNTISIRNTAGRINSSKFNLNRLTLSFEGSVIDFDVTEIDSDVNEISYILWFLPKELYGRFQGALAYSGLYNGRLSLAAFGYDPKNKTISDINSTVNINNNTLKEENISLKINGYPAKLSIATHDTSFKRFFAKITADKMKIDIPEGGGSDGYIPPVEVNGSIQIKELEHDRYKFANVNALFSLSESRLNLTRLQAGFSGGTINMQSSINMGSPRATGDALINFDGVRVHELFQHWEKLDRRIFGSLAGRSKIDFELSKNFYKSLNGSVEFSIEKGKIVDTGIQHGLGIWLSELKYKLRDLEFNKIYGNLTLQGENISVNSFIFNSPNIRLNIKGAIDKKLVADFITIDLEFTSQFISDLTPAVIIGLSKYRDGSWYTVPFSASGDLTDGSNIKRLR